jgi:crotonobetainyl-CoA:carnitine CoA-transferase CaiB-like acyl-CoA transferase
LSSDLAGSYCARLLTTAGMAVVKVEPPAGDPLRRRGPFPNEAPDPERSAIFLHLNAGKQSITLDVTQPAGRDLLLRLAAASDVVVEDAPPGYFESLGLGYEALRKANRRVILTSITPFGEEGPYRDYKATEIGLHAASGELYLAGQPPMPLKKGGNVAQYLGGVNGLIATMGALFRREMTGEGSHAEVSLVESMSSIIGGPLREESNGGYIPGRRPGGLGWPNNVYPCKDGYMMTFTAYGVGNAWWRPFAEMVREDEDFGYLATAPDLFESPQLAYRGFFKKTPHPVAGQQTALPLPFLVNDERLPVERAPLLGEHNDAVYAEFGLSSDEVERLHKEGVV